MRILLVDDDCGMISVWSRFLQPLNAEIFVASNVDTAIDEMRKVPPPDLVLLDLILPPHGARETVKAIVKLREFNANLIIIVISGMDEKRLLETIANAHVEGVLHKGDEITQGKLLRAMLAALAKNPNSGELLESVGKIVARLTEVEERKKTGPINLA